MVGLDFPSPAQLSTDQDAIRATRSALQGAYIAQQDFNKRSTIKLRLLLVNTGDDKNYLPIVAQQIASIVKSDPTVVGILGWQTSATTMNMTSDLYKDGVVNIPIVSQSASYDYLSQASSFIFQVAPLDQEQADVALTLTKMLGKTQAIVFMDPKNDLFSQNIGQDFEQGFTTTFHSTPIEEDFTVDQTNADSFYAELTDALKHVQHPDQLVVFFACTTNYDTTQFQDALARLGNAPSFPVIAGDAGYVAYPASYNRWYVLAYAFHDEYRTLMGNDSPFFQEYKDAFNANHQHNGWYGYDIPDAPTIITYDTASIFTRSIDLAYSGSNHQITPQKVEYQLGQIIWTGVSGQINLTSNNTPNDRALIVLKVVQQVDKAGKEQTGFHMYCMHGTFASSANHSIPAC
jgi:ABC-type branched-subunit amino acid transport system substrate-binding protein